MPTDCPLSGRRKARGKGNECSDGAGSRAARDAATRRLCAHEAGRDRGGRGCGRCLRPDGPNDAGRDQKNNLTYQNRARRGDTAAPRRRNRKARRKPCANELVTEAVLQIRPRCRANRAILKAYESEDFSEDMDAFLNKRAPIWKVKLPAGVEQSARRRSAFDERCCIDPIMAQGRQLPSPGLFKSSRCQVANANHLTAVTRTQFPHVTLN